MRLTSGDPSHRAHTQLRVKKKRAATPRQQLSRARDRLTCELPLKSQNRWPSKASSLVSEAFTEINAGLVIVLASRHRSPIPESDLVDPDRDPDELATIASTAYRDHVESFLSTTQPPCDTETAVSSGLLGSPLLGTATRCAADWRHAWSILGQWSGLVTFPVPATGQWPRHGHLRGILAGQICQSQAFNHPCHAAIDGGYHPASTCETSPPHMGHSSSSNFQVLPSTR